MNELKTNMNKQANRKDKLPVFVQVNTSGEASKSGTQDSNEAQQIVQIIVKGMFMFMFVCFVHVCLFCVYVCLLLFIYFFFQNALIWNFED